MKIGDFLIGWSASGRVANFDWTNYTSAHYDHEGAELLLNELMLNTFYKVRQFWLADFVLCALWRVANSNWPQHSAEAEELRILIGRIYSNNEEWWISVGRIILRHLLKSAQFWLAYLKFVLCTLWKVANSDWPEHSSEEWRILIGRIIPMHTMRSGEFLNGQIILRHLWRSGQFWLVDIFCAHSEGWRILIGRNVSAEGWWISIGPNSCKTHQQKWRKFFDFFFLRKWRCQKKNHSDLSLIDKTLRMPENGPLWVVLRSRS